MASPLPAVRTFWNAQAGTAIMGLFMGLGIGSGLCCVGLGIASVGDALLGKEKAHKSSGGALGALQGTLKSGVRKLLLFIVLDIFHLASQPVSHT